MYGAFTESSCLFPLAEDVPRIAYTLRTVGKEKRADGVDVDFYYKSSDMHGNKDARHARELLGYFANYIMGHSQRGLRGRLYCPLGTEYAPDNWSGAGIEFFGVNSIDDMGA